MSFYQSRLRRLEAQQQRGGRVYHGVVVRVPWDVPYDEMFAWALAHARCPCGVEGCEQLRIGIVPEMAPDAESWFARYGTQDREPEAIQAARDAWYAQYMGGTDEPGV
jgi:hypothetical protein